MKPGPIIAFVIIVGALSFALFSFKGSLVAYMPFQQAVQAASTGATVQIMGAPVKNETHYDLDRKALMFTLAEATTGKTMPVLFRSPKPDNFDEAVRITAIGHYDPTQQIFLADNLLVKCPSKYAGQTGGVDRSYLSKT